MYVHPFEHFPGVQQDVNFGLGTSTDVHAIDVAYTLWAGS